MNFRKQLRVTPGKKFSFKDWDPNEKGGFEKEEAQRIVSDNIALKRDLQYTLYAEGQRSLLIVLQGMDAAGKDGTVRSIMTGVNPQGFRITSFKKPSERERAHDFLWRVHRATPARGEIGIFNRSHYEDVLIVRVHNLVPPAIWQPRYDQINDFERLLTEHGTTILKFFLHIDKDEQKERFEARLENPQKNWKFNPADLAEREHWDDYQKAFDVVMERCSTDYAPWYIIPANRKWFRNLAISSIVVETLQDMNLKIPKPDFDPTSFKVT